jgi:hypothetical protein
MAIAGIAAGTPDAADPVDQADDRGERGADPVTDGRSPGRRPVSLRDVRLVGIAPQLGDVVVGEGFDRDRVHGSRLWLWPTIRRR